MPTRDNEQLAYFTIVGEFDPADLTSRIGVQPSESWIKGGINEKTHFERRLSRWSVHSRLTRQAALEDHIRDVIQRLSPFADLIRQLGIEYETAIQVVGYFYLNYPGLNLPAAMLSELADLGVGLDFDFYYLYSDAREDSL